MKETERLRMLARMAQMIQEVELARLAQANLACSKSRSLIEQLGDGTTPRSAAQIPAALAAEKHQIWKVQRRISLNQKLALQMAEMMTQKDRAREAFGRASVLRRLADKSR